MPYDYDRRTASPENERNRDIARLQTAFLNLRDAKDLLDRTATTISSVSPEFGQQYDITSEIHKAREILDKAQKTLWTRARDTKLKWW